MTNSDLREKLTDTLTLLGVPGVGRGRYNKLVSAFGSPERVLTASVAQLSAVPGISRSTASAIREQNDPDKARKSAARIVQLGWRVTFLKDSDFPPLLKRIGDPPPVLFSEGDLLTPDDKLVAIVGTRHASEGGRRYTHALAGKLAEAGLIVVSGMAEGIDAAAHKGALDAGGRTVAVWGTPLNLVYPPSNRELAERIKEKGLVYSEYLPEDQPSPSNFPERNRIVSGLSEAVIVIEAGRKSGALITAHYCIEQGRELFAVPGPPYSPRSIGCNQLIKEGARLLTDIDDLFNELPRLCSAVTAGKLKQTIDLTDTERTLVDMLAQGPLQIDQIARESGLPVAAILEYLLALELKGVVEELSGKRFALVQ